VYVGAAADHADPGGAGVVSEQPGALERPHLPVAEGIARGELERHHLGGDHVLEGAALVTRKTLELSFLRRSGSESAARMTPPSGPPNVLCVVDVTTWGCGSGDGCRP
jgi:hypothetical protein